MKQIVEANILKNITSNFASKEHKHNKTEIGISNVTNVALNWSWGTVNPTHIWGSQGDSSQSYVYNGTQLKAFVGLTNVNNWGATAAINNASDVTYATAGAVKKAYDLANAHTHSVTDVITTGITTARFIFAGGVGVEYSQGAIEIREVGQVAKTKSTYDYAPSIGFHWAMTAAGSLALHADGNFYLRGQGFTGTQYRSLTASNFFVGTNPVYHAGNKPTAADIGALPSAGKAVDSALLNGANEAVASTINTISKRDGSGDISVRLLRSEYANQNTIGGAVAYRTNNTADNYVRFCSDTAAIRTWLGTAATLHNHTTLTGVTDITGAGSSGTWGSLNIGGVKASWAGINFTGVGHTFMIDANGQAGVWQSAGACKWYFDSTGTLAVGNVGWDKIANKPIYVGPSGNVQTTNVDTVQSGLWPSIGNTSTGMLPAGIHNGNGLISLNTHPGDYCSQVWFNTNANKLHFRNKNAGAWTGWQDIYHSGNFNPDNYVPKSGTEMSGRLKITKDCGVKPDYNTGQLEITAPSGTGSAACIGFHRGGVSAHSLQLNSEFLGIGVHAQGGALGDFRASTIWADRLNINGLSSSGIYAGNGDNALYDTYNLKIKSWWGIGFESYDGINRIVMDTRNGNISTIGSIYIGNGKIPMCINASSYDFSGGMWGQMTIGATMCAGTITTTGVATMSDKRVKENIIYLNTEENELYDFFLNDFKPATFNYIHDESKQIQYGFIAQDLVDNKIGELILSTPMRGVEWRRQFHFCLGFSPAVGITIPAEESGKVCV